MMDKLFDSMMNEYDSGAISRRELVARIAGITAAVAGVAQGARAQDAAASPFKATGVNHVALRVTNVPKSRDFYVQHLGFTPTRDSATSCFLQADHGFVALFRGNEAKMDHYCVAIENYDVEEAEKKLNDLSLNPRREGNRIYFPDPDGLTVQLSADDHSA